CSDRATAEVGISDRICPLELMPPLSGPLMVTDPTTKRSSVIGIVSAGIGCALPKVQVFDKQSLKVILKLSLPKLPGLYTRVTAYLDWIAKTAKLADEVDPITATTPVSTLPTWPTIKWP